MHDSRHWSDRLGVLQAKSDSTRPVLQHGLPSRNLLYLGDNLDCIRDLKDRGFRNKLELVYIDPPFHSGTRYYYRSKNRIKPAFEDVWKSEEYFDMLQSRLAEIRELMSPAGSIFVHLDWHALHYVKVTMDRIFGIKNFRNEIIVKRGRKKNLQYQFSFIDRMHNAYDSILWYSKTETAKFSPPLIESHSDAKWMGFWSNIDRPTMRYSIFGYTPERGQWKWSRDRAQRAIRNYDLYLKFSPSMSLESYWNLTGRSKEFIRKRGSVKYAEYWIPPKSHRILDNVWLDIECYNYSTGYSTEKHKDLLERILSQFSKPGDLVADFFCGSGTTLVAAEKLGRRWIGCDSSSRAIAATKKRLGDARYAIVEK